MRALVLALAVVACTPPAYADQTVRFELAERPLPGDIFLVCTATSSRCAPATSLVLEDVAQGAHFTPGVRVTALAPATPAGVPAWIAHERPGSGAVVPASNRGTAFWACANDRTADGVVGGPDFSSLLRRYNTGTPASAPEIAQLLAAFGERCQ